jgi:hypothetical protein
MILFTQLWIPLSTAAYIILFQASILEKFNIHSISTPSSIAVFLVQSSTGTSRVHYYWHYQESNSWYQVL